MKLNKQGMWCRLFWSRHTWFKRHTL